MKIAQVCRDHGRPGCLSAIDERYTMRFDDINEEPIYWCSHCGPEAEALRQYLEALPVDTLMRVGARVERATEAKKATEN